jgi:hypothetical protein
VAIYLGENGNDAAWKPGVVLTVAGVAMVINYNLFYYTSFDRQFVKQFHWFGLIRRQIPVGSLTSVSLYWSRFSDGPHPFLRLISPSEQMDLNLIVYGDDWIKSVVTGFQEEGFQSTMSCWKRSPTTSSGHRSFASVQPNHLELTRR